MGEPPVFIPLLQVNPIIEAVVTTVLSVRLIGALGTYKIIAPFPGKESKLSPYRFVAVTVANTGSP